MSTDCSRGGRQLAALALMVAAIGCAPPQPLTLSNNFTPPRASFPSSKNNVGLCAVRFGEVKDVRADRHSMGALAYRQVYHDDSEAWLRSGLGWLRRDGRLKVLEGSEPGALVVSVEIIKAYIATITGTEKSVTIVLRAKFSRGEANLGEEIVRGNVNTMNWANGDSEIQSSFDSALEDSLRGLDASIIAHCGS